jgi:methionine synthase II (cobalamin-independent)
MFSTLLGPLPAIPNLVAALEEIGLELLASGEPPLGRDVAAGDVVTAWREVAELTERPVKQALLGPYASGDGAAPDRLAEAITALAVAGCPFVEVVEPDLAPIVGSAAERDRFVAGHRALFAALGSEDPGVHCSLVVGGGNLDTAGAATFFDLPYPSYAFDLLDGPDNWRLIAGAPTDRGIVCGALSSRADGDETREVLVWAAQYAASTSGRGADRVGLANAGSLADLPPDVALRKLRRVAEAARIASASSAEEVAVQLDSRAFGGRRNRPGGPASRYHPVPPAPGEPVPPVTPTAEGDR